MRERRRARVTPPRRAAPASSIRDPRPRVHAVRDRPDRHVVGARSGQRPCHISRDTSPWSSETPFAYAAVRSANGVRPKPPSSGATLPSAANVSQSKPHRSTSAPTFLRTSSGSKTSFPAGTGVCVVNTVDARSRCTRRVAVDAVVGELAEPLELQERGMPFVHVEDRRLDPERAQRAHAADAEHELLVDPVLAVAAVQRVGDLPRPVRVAVDVRVEEVERDPPDLRLPHLRSHIRRRRRRSLRPRPPA